MVRVKHDKPRGIPNVRAADATKGLSRYWPSGDLALELGYADQAHFIRDFKRLVGRSPAEYARRLEQVEAPGFR